MKNGGIEEILIPIIVSIFTTLITILIVTTM